MKTLNVGVIGAGFMGKAHSLAYAAMPMFFWPVPAIPKRYIIAEASNELASEAAIRFGYETHTSDWRALVADPQVDVVDIATPNHLHATIAIAAAEAGKHVICEKPLARTSAEAKMMLDAVEAAGVVHMVAFNYRRTPAVALAKKLIDEGAIGRILNFRGTYLQDWSADPDGPLSWRFQKAIAGSGAVGDIATHVIDLARYLVGEVSEVNALLRTYIDTRPQQTGGADKLAASDKHSDAPRLAVDVDDEVLTMLRFANGAVGSLEATRNAYGRNNFLTFEIHGEIGSIAFNYERRDELQLMLAERRPRPPRISHDLHRPRPPLRRRSVADSRARHRLWRNEDHRDVRLLPGGGGRRAGIAELCRRLPDRTHRRRDPHLRRRRSMGDRSTARAGRRVDRAVPVVAMHGVTKSFNGVRVLNAVDFTLEPGEVHALVGGNGAGKSTLMKILEGVYSLDEGSIEVDGTPVRLTSGLDARRHGIAMIFQEFSLIPSFTVAQNVFLTCEPRGPLGTLDDREAERRARELFTEIGVSIDVRERMSALSTAYWQLTEIAKAMAQDARVLIMDEPTSSLATSETRALFALIERLKERGLSIVYISHRLEEVFEISDRVTILRDGRVVHTGPTSELSTDQAIDLIVGRKVEETLRWRPREVNRDGQPLLEVRDLDAGPRVRGSSFDVYGGEIVGLAGLMGSGRTELAQALFGIQRIDSGTVRVRGREVRIRNSRDAIAAGIALIPEDRRIQGLVLDHTVAGNLTLTLLRALTSHGVIRRSLEMDLAQRLADQLDITSGMLFRPVRLLSGGNQQKVVIAKWLGRDPDLLIMDEPTAGIDIGTKGEIVEMIRRLADSGKAVILISSEAPELLAAADRILAIHRGAIVGSYDRRDVEDEAALQTLVQEGDRG